MLSLVVERAKRLQGAKNKALKKPAKYRGFLRPKGKINACGCFFGRIQKDF